VNVGPDHERWADAAGAYLLGALPDDELSAYEAHLAACETCQADVDSLKVAVDALPMTAPQVAPPAALKDRIMVEVRREASLLAAAGPEADRPTPAPSRSPEPRRRRFGFALPAPLAAVLAAGALAVGLVVGGAVFGGGGGSRTVTASVDRTFAPRASAQLQIHDGHAVLVVQRMPAPRGGRVYEVWLQRSNGAVVPTNALFTPRRDGAARTSVTDSLSGVKQVLVSSEPPGGSQQPTTKPVIAARVS
jgi:anti-sigma factor RsiW